jgi:hypothetical protein
VLSDVLLPAELKLINMGNPERVVDSRTSFQAATRADFVAAIEGIVFRKVIAFASGIDPENNTVFETFTFAPRVLTDGGADGAGAG